MNSSKCLEAPLLPRFAIPSTHLRYRIEVFLLVLLCLVVGTIWTLRQDKEVVDIVEQYATPCVPTNMSAPITTQTPHATDSLVYRGVVESMDGKGYAFKKAETVLDPRFEELNRLPDCEKDNFLPSKLNIVEVMSAFKDCITKHIDSFRAPENLWKIMHSWESETNKCADSLDLSSLKIEEFKNQHESKYALLPKCKEEHTMVTLGVGHEVSAELGLNRTLPNVKFYGVDPIIEPNIQLYSQFGRFFPFAIGRQSGTDRFRVLPNQNQKTRKYMFQDVTTIEVVYVLKDIMKLHWIDYLWIDTEGAETQFLDYFFKGGRFDLNDITICQFNVEFHITDGYVQEGPQKFFKFVDQLVKDGRYLFLNAKTTGVGVFRMFFINMENAKCLKKFIP